MRLFGLCEPPKGSVKSYDTVEASSACALLYIFEYEICVFKKINAGLPWAVSVGAVASTLF